MVFSGAFEKIRTSGLLLRRETLYPAELRMHVQMVARFFGKIKAKQFKNRYAHR